MVQNPPKYTPKKEAIYLVQKIESTCINLDSYTAEISKSIRPVFIRERRPVNPIIQFFEYEHLPITLQKVSQPICELAESLNLSIPDGLEKSAGLRKLLEAKDCFIRASLDK